MDINLLPWRAEMLAYNKKVLLGGLLVAVAVAAMATLFFYQIFFMQVRVGAAYQKILLQSEKTTQDAIKPLLVFKKEYADEASKVATLAQLRYSQYETVWLFNEITKVIPEGIHLTTLTRKNENVQLSGVSNSNLLISELVKSIETSRLLSGIAIEKVEKQEKNFSATTQFHLFMTMKSFQLPSIYAVPDQKTQSESESESKASGIQNPITKIKDSQRKQMNKINRAVKGRP